VLDAIIPVGICLPSVSFPTEMWLGSAAKRRRKLTTLGAVVLHAQILLQVRQVDDLALSVLAIVAGKGQRIGEGSRAARLEVTTAVIGRVNGSGRVIVRAAVESQCDTRSD
jgi:hypothetical protein